MNVGGRRDSRYGQLIRCGFTDPAAAVRLLDSDTLRSHSGDRQLLDALATTPDPDLGLRSLVRIAEAEPEAERAVLLDTLTASKPLRDRLLSVLGASEALGDHLAAHPGEWRNLAAFDTAAELRPQLEDFEAALADADDPDSLRVSYRRALMLIAARDVTGTSGFTQAAAELSDLATATIRAALRIATAELPDEAQRCRLAVIGLGKCGGRELNYVSDVDVIFVAEPVSSPPADSDGAGPGGGPGSATPAASLDRQLISDDEGPALRAATQLAARLMRICSDTTAEGTIWPVDANLRPEGRNGPLVRTLYSHLAYYDRWAKTWEFQALLKARPMAGDTELGAAYHEAVTTLVWHAADRENFVTDVQQMRRRVEESIPAAVAARELKLGPGGLRDVEFAVQLLQLVHGRADPTVRSSTTLEALEALARGGYVGRQDAAQLDASYRFLRTIEHRIQLYRLRRTHLMPEVEDEQRRLGRSLGYFKEPLSELARVWRQHTSVVRRLHEKLFYRPLLEAVAQLEAGEARLSLEAARARLVALGYADPTAALRHLRALGSGVSRKAAIQRTLLPVLLDWFADSADPDAGLLGFRKVSDALGATPWYLRLLRDEGAAAENLARVVSTGRFATDLLLRAPEAVALLSGDEALRPRSRAALQAEILAAVSRHQRPDDAIAAVRGVRRRELFRTAAADVIDAYTEPGAYPSTMNRVGEALTSLNAAALAGALRTAVRDQWGDTLPARIAIIGMGRFGGQEMNYGSDADVMFVYEAQDGVTDPEAAKAAFAVANDLRRLLQIPATDPPLLIDADLRPEGKNGPLVRSLASYRAYYQRWSATWESQALLRAAPMAGDAELGARFIELINPLRYPEGGPGPDAEREIRRLKARMEAERLPRGADSTLHTKLGRGGLSDVEWTVQLLQLRHAWQQPALRTPSTRAALAAAHDAGLLDDEDTRTLDEAWLLASRVRNAVLLVRGRAADTFPSETRELAAVARYLGYEPGHAGEALEDYRRATRRARTVVDRLFYEG